MQEKMRLPEKDCETSTLLVPPCSLNMGMKSEQLLILILNIPCRTETEINKNKKSQKLWITYISKMYK